VVFLYSEQIALFERWKATNIHIVFEVGYLHLSANGVGRQATNILFVVLPVLTCHKQQTVYYILRKALLKQVLGCSIGVLQHVVEQGYHLG
jgi:hypothetical protein